MFKLYIMSGGKIDDGSEYKTHLDLGVQIDEANIINYELCQLPLIFENAERTRVGNGNPFQREKEEWKRIGKSGVNGWGKTGDILINYIRFVLEKAGARIPDEKASALDEIRITMNTRYDYIMGESVTSGAGGIDTSLGDANTRGLLNLFKYKAQLAQPDGSIPQCGGPTDFFRFLFDFVVPPKKKLNTLCKKDNIRAILEKPPAAGKTGQCWKAYGDQVNDDEEDYDNRLWKEIPPDDKRMHCYICEVKLKSKHKSYIDSFFPNRTKHRDFQCEHLFPFTEGMLFWILYRDSFVAQGNPYKNSLLDLQKREYAPVCRHCNVDLKTSLSILRLNPLWLTTEDQTKPIVILNEHSIDRISGKFPITALPNHESKYLYLKTAGERKIRLMNVFNPMVEAVNNSIKKSGVKTRKELLKFLIYKYLFYFDENIMENIQKMFIGGGGTKKLLKEKKERNTIFSGMIKTLSDLYKQYKNRVTSSVKKQQETEQANTKAQRDAEGATARRKEAAYSKAAAALEAANTAQQQTQQAQQKAERFNYRFREIFSRKFGLGSAPTDEQIIDKISNLRGSIRGDCGTDFIKENPNTVNMMNELLGAPSSGGGSKLKHNQKGGNQKWVAAQKCNTDYNNLYGTLEEFMQAPRRGEAYISGINEIIGLFSSMTLDYVEENDTQTDKLINEVLDKTVEKEKVEYGDIEFNLADERRKLLKAIEYEEALIQANHGDQISMADFEHLNQIYTVDGGDAMIKEAFNRRENDSNCDTEKTVEKYSAELDPEGVQKEKEVKEHVKNIRDLLSPLRQTDIRDLGVATPRTKAIREADKSVPRFDFRWQNWNSTPPHCLLCTKGNNTRALNSENNTLYSISRHYPETQNRIHNLVYKGKKVEGNPPAKFCPHCKTIMERKINSMNHDPKQVLNILNFLSENFRDKIRLRQDLVAQLTTRYRSGSLDYYGFSSGASSSNMEDTRKKGPVGQVDKNEKLKVLNTKVRREIKEWLRGFRVGQRVGFLPQFTNNRSNNGTIMIINKDRVFITPDGFPRGRGITIYFNQMMTNWPNKLFWICAVQKSAVPMLPPIGTNAQFITRRPPCKRSSSTGVSKESPFGDKDKSKRKSGKREGGGKRSKKKTKRKKRKKKKTRRKNKRKKKTKRRRKKKKKTRRRR